MERGAEPRPDFRLAAAAAPSAGGADAREARGGGHISTRGVSDLERGVTRTAHNDTARLLATALGLDEPARELFMAAARGRSQAGEVLAVRAGAEPGSFSAAATRALPRDIASFTGRQAELARLLASVEDLAAGGGVVGIHAIDGMAGVGKSTFAVHAAHRLTENFPDGQFFLGLHAHTPGRQPVAPADALVSLLLTAGVTARQIPSGVEAGQRAGGITLRARRVCCCLTTRPAMNRSARSLPGTSGRAWCGHQPPEADRLQDTTVISLDTLTPEEAATLLVRLAGRRAGHRGLRCRRDHQLVRIPATGSRHARRPAPPPPDLDTSSAGGRPDPGPRQASRDACRERLSRCRVWPILPGPHREAAAAVSSAQPSPRAGHRRSRRRLAR